MTEEALRVTVLSPSAELGGAERSLLTFLRAAPAEGVEACLVLPRRGPLCGKLAALGVTWQVVEQPGALLRQSRSAPAGALAALAPLAAQAPGYLWRLGSAVRRTRADVLYANGVKCHVLSALLGPALRVPVVWHARLHWEAAWLGRIADVGADLIIANSHSTARAVSRLLADGTPVEVVHNAVDVERFRTEGPRADLPQAPAGPRVGLPAALARLKGHGLLLEAAPLVLKRFPKARFFFIGGPIYDTLADRGYEAELRREVEARGLDGAVTLTGFQHEMAPWYRAMDVVVSASVRPEGFGRTLLEAMACGRAVAGPDAGGVPEFVEHGVSGLLYPMGDARALAGAVLTLLGDSALRARLGEAGRRTAVARFTAQGHAAALAGALRRAAAGHKGSRLGRQRA